MSLINQVPFLTFSIIILIFGIHFYKQKPTFWNHLVTITFVVYSICVFHLIFTVAKFSFSTSIYQYISIGKAHIVVIPFQNFDLESFLNIIMTLPLGIYLYLFTKRLNFMKVFSFSLLIGLFNETTQFILDQLINLNRTVDIMDVINNCLGIIIGYYLTKLIKKAINN